ncbi:restriction endonuclease subunit S [Cetobacterium sp.]|uniref:restriction endonuclease subunit S n=1 Tax=Cetobacterium sp. TaxID=2071632 RepID=UPI003F3C3FAE
MHKNILEKKLQNRRFSFIKEITKYTAKTSVDSVRMKMLTKMDIPATSLTEQEKIANFLFSIDEKIEAVEEELVKELKKVFYRKYLFNY